MLQVTPAMRRLQARHGSFDPNRYLRTRWTNYDYIQYPTAGSNELQWFNIPQGQPDPNNTAVTKTLEQTNMLETRQLPYDFAIKQIRTHIRIAPKARQGAANLALTNYCTATGAATGLRDSMAALLDLMIQGTLVISLGQKEWYDIPQPFVTCPPGFGFNLYEYAVTAGTTVGDSLWVKQSSDSGDVHNVPTQLVEAGQVISARLIFDNANSPALPNIASSTKLVVEIGLLLDGYVVQPVQ